MPFSDSNRVTVRYVEEGSWASTASAAPPMVELPLTSESLKSSVNTVISDTIRSDRNIQDVVIVGGGAGGDLGFELVYSDWDELLEGALQSDIVTTTASAAIASAYFSGGNIIADSSGLVDILTDQFVRVKNATTGTNDGDFRVTAVSTPTAGTTKIFLSDASSGSAASFSSEIFAAGTTLKGKRLRNGTTAKSYLFEKEFADVGNTFQKYAGMRVGSMNLSIESQSILTGSFTFVGKSQATSSTTVASTTAAASTNPVMNASGNVGRIWEGSNAVSGVSFKSISIDLNNNTREQDAIGTNSLVGIGTGRAEITGSISAYFEDNSLIDKFVGGTATSIRFQVDDSNGNSYIITIPKIRFTDVNTVATGPNNDVMVDISWSAMINDDALFAIQIDILDN